jgi:hypothetical protein
MGKIITHLLHENWGAWDSCTLLVSMVSISKQGPSMTIYNWLELWVASSSEHLPISMTHNISFANESINMIALWTLLQQRGVVMLLIDVANKI